MKSCYLSLAALFCVMAATGCTFVTSSAPVGSEVYKIEKPDQWNGIWVAEKVEKRKNELLDDTKYAIEIIEPENGLLLLTSITTDDKTGQAKKQYSEVLLRSAEGRIIASAFDMNEGNYLWCPLSLSPDTITLSMPDGEQFKKAIQAGDLPGQKTNLKDLTSESLQYILRDNFQTLFFKDGDLVFHREKASKSKGKKK